MTGVVFRLRTSKTIGLAGAGAAAPDWAGAAPAAGLAAGAVAAAGASGLLSAGLAGAAGAAGLDPLEEDWQAASSEPPAAARLRLAAPRRNARRRMRLA